MPLTFLSHQAVVLPLKIATPRATSGTALVLGSMAPDVEYFLRGYPVATVSHTWIGQLTFCLPVTLVLFWVVTRIIAEPAAVHAPELGDLHLDEYALLARQPGGLRHWGIVVLSALIGSVSHVLLDGLERALGVPPYHALTASTWWVLANVGLWLVLAAITLRMMEHIGRRHLLRRWDRDRRGERHSGRDTSHPPTPDGYTTGHPRDLPGGPPSIGAHPANPTTLRGGATIFWGWVAFSSVIGAGLGMIFRKPGWFLHQLSTWIHIWLWSVSGAFVGLVLASVAWHVARAQSVSLRGNE